MYWNVASVNRLGKWNSDGKEALECDKGEQTRKMTEMC